MESRLAILVLLGSGIGGLARYALASLFVTPGFPWAIFAINALGCFLIGLLLFGGMIGGWMPLAIRVFVGIGLLGGFTTMSAFTFDTIELASTGSAWLALLNVALTLVVCLAATWLGRVIAVAVWGQPSA